MITDGSTVSLHYTLTVEGDVVDGSADGDPLEFQVGGGQVIPGFDKGVLGMKVGDKKSFRVSPDEGYGPQDPEAVQEVLRSQLPPDIQPEAGMTLYAAGPDGQPIPLRVATVREDCIVIDMNHPLAGKTLDFDVEIVGVR